MFIVAYSGFKRWQRQSGRSFECEIQAELENDGEEESLADAEKQYAGRLSKRKTEKESRSAFGGQDDGNPTGQRLQNGISRTLEGSKKGPAIMQSQRSDWWSTEPDVGRVAHGIFKRVDRLRCLGNAVVPAQIYPILRAITEMEGSREQN